MNRIITLKEITAGYALAGIALCLGFYFSIKVGGEDDGDVIGAVGISGDLGDNDEACALVGIKAVGLSAIQGSRE